MRELYSHPSSWGMVLLVVTSLGVLASGAIADLPAPQLSEQGDPPATPNQEQPEVLSRGPVHEAFAEPVNLQLQAGLIAPDRPPPNIEETPPAERPQGQQFVWIPGYWSWDADRRGYIWVSACWRVAPPRMSWVPGYWSQVSGGWEWVAGFWTPAGVSEVEYLPVPPTVGNAEPYGVAPSSDTIWVPPCMYWIQGQYVRRAGYWLAAQPNWVWVPSHYVATPRGCVFAGGHWDYSLERRGVLFAPLCFAPSVYGRSNIRYSPSIVIDVGLLRVSLFAYPRYSHYFFGDYYDAAYLSIGIFPWFDSRRLHSWYDPVYEHDRWRNLRSEPRWEERERSEYNRRCDDRDLRPARTFREQESRLAKLSEPQRRAFQVAQPIASAVARRGTPMKFERINTDARQKISKQATAVATFRDERNRWESASAGPKTAQTPKEGKPSVTPQAEPRQTSLPAKESKPVVTPQAERRQNSQPAKESKPVVTPQAERRQSVQPSSRETRESTVTAPSPRKETPPLSPQRTSAVAPSRETRVAQSERVQIPVSPVVGRSGAPGIFQRGPPSRPADENRDKEGKDSRRK